MADVGVLDDEPKQEESTASVKSDLDETSQETPNGVKTWVETNHCSDDPIPIHGELTLAKMESMDVSYC